MNWMRPAGQLDCSFKRDSCGPRAWLNERKNEFSDWLTVVDYRLIDGIGEDVHDGYGSGTGSIGVGTGRRRWPAATIGAPPLLRHRTAAPRIERSGPHCARIPRPGPISRTLQRRGHRSSRSRLQGNYHYQIKKIYHNQILNLNLIDFD